VTPEQRERAEAAFGHVQHAATEMILAAHDALDLLGDVVSAAGVGGMLDRLNGAGGGLFKRPAPPPAAADPASGADCQRAADHASEQPGPAAGAPGARSRHYNRVERIPVR
jgi:hypothetical protein